MDVLADILSAIDLRASLYFRAELGSAFSIEVPENQGYIRFHLAGPGRAWIGLPSGEGVYCEEGDLVLIPHGSAHTLANEPGSPAQPLKDVLEQADMSHVGRLRYGVDAGAVVLICGRFGFSPSFTHPIVSTLPSLVHIKHGDNVDFKWLIPLLNTMQMESRERMAGYEAVLVRLSEIIFIHILRTYMQHQPDSTIALTALADRHLKAVLEEIHKNPGFAWSVERLAEVANLSRSSFAERFKRKLYMTPMHYLTTWRMQKARILLRDNKLSVSDVSKAVGYASDSSFSRVFKEHYGVSPKAYRRSVE